MSTPDMAGLKNQEGGIGASVQRVGRFLSAMIMPNIGAFVAWGLITALFIPTGWLPNDTFVQLVGPMIINLLPILIGYTGGHIVHGNRGAVIGAVATMGAVVGADVPMFLGGMVMGPFAAWVLKKLDSIWAGKVRAGFEMLVDNFSLGILGMLLAMLGQVAVGPFVSTMVEIAGNGVDTLVSNNVLPLASIFIEPAKVLFLNNAINHGVLTPLGTAESLETGKSLLFTLESNPGPGLGLLLAYWFFGGRVAKGSAPGAIIIHFFGGIHEIYFPYVLMKPKMIAAMIVGGATGILTGVIFGGGLVGPPSPGSIFAYIAVTPRDGFVAMIAQVAFAAAASFVISMLLLKTDKSADAEDEVSA